MSRNQHRDLDGPSQAFQATTSQLQSEAGLRPDSILRIQVLIIELDSGQGKHPRRNTHTDDLTVRHPVPCIVEAETAKSPVNRRDKVLRSPKR